MEPKKKTELQKSKDSRRGGEFVPSPRPSQRQRKTDGQSEPCQLCGSNEWDTDISRGETVCSVCFYLLIWQTILSYTQELKILIS